MTVTRVLEKCKNGLWVKQLRDVQETEEGQLSALFIQYTYRAW
jgi:hypothetical protein